MPASICDSVSNALRLSLTAEESQNSSLLDSRLYSSAKNVLLSKIEFEESGDYQSNVLDGLKSKYVVIRPKKPMLDSKHLKKESNANNQLSDFFKNGEDGLPRPKRVLFAIEKVQLGWQSPWAAGAGMQNVGNTCYLNSTLQALFHVPALANWLISESAHVEKCNQQEACVICGMRATLIATQKSGGAPIKPWQVYSKLRLICRHLTPGRQEDAHEFLRYLVEAMEKCYLSRFVNSDKLDQYTKESTPLNQILGGYLRSTVRCLACHHLSTTYQHFQDLLLDIRKHSTLDDALDSFFSRERLEDLGYKCEACNKKVSATKQFLVERAPMVLCIALKRFSLAGGKLSKHVQYRKKISLNKYMYNKNNQQPLTYKLVSLVTHLGPSQNCGHYTAIGQAPNTNYYQFDDSCVRPLPLSAVLGTNAYIMFFEKDAASEEPAACTSGAVYGPRLPEDTLVAEKSPLKLTFYQSDDKKASVESNSNQADSKPIILNSILGAATTGTQLEPWVVKQNGEVEKLTQSTKILDDGGVDKTDDDKKISFMIKREEARHRLGCRNDVSHVRTPEKILTGSKLVKPPKSPLEKLEEQMKKSDVCSRARLVPYESESSGDELLASAGAWTVSGAGPLLSPSLNGVTNQKVKEKEERRTTTEQSPNTSVSSMSPLSDRSEATARADNVTTDMKALVDTKAIGANTASMLAEPAAKSLLTLSHRGYGAPVSSWKETQSSINRQVFEERRDERKRVLETSDDMDRGRNKKVKKFHNFNRFNNNRNHYNPFQEKQNKSQWNGGGFQYRSDRRPHHFKHHNKYKRFNRYGSSHHYPRHH